MVHRSGISRCSPRPTTPGSSKEEGDLRGSRRSSFLLATFFEETAVHRRASCIRRQFSDGLTNERSKQSQLLLLESVVLEAAFAVYFRPDRVVPWDMLAIMLYARTRCRNAAISLGSMHLSHTIDGRRLPQTGSSLS